VRRRFSSTWNFRNRIRVSRDFIDSYSPEVQTRPAHSPFAQNGLKTGILPGAASWPSNTIEPILGG
jgi:hypothetical protein